MRGCFLLDRKLRSLSSKTLRRIALRRNRIMSQIRPAADGEFRKRNSFYHIGNYSAILCDKNTLRVRMRTRMRGSIASQSCSARQKCACFAVYYNARVCEAHFCSDIGNYSGILCHKNTLRVRCAFFDPADVYRISALFVREQRTAWCFSVRFYINKLY